MIWMLIGYMWLEIHRPYEIWPWLASFRAERVYAVITIIWWLLTSARFPPRNRLHVAFGAFIAVMLASWAFSYDAAVGEGAVENYLKFAVFYVLAVTSVRSERDLRLLLGGYLGAMALWMAHGLREYYCGNQQWAQGLIRLVPVGATYDFNDFAGLIVCSLPVAWVLWRECDDRWKRLLIIGYCALSGFCIVKTGSRMGFVGMILAAVLTCLPSPKRWRMLALFVVAFVVIWSLLPAGQQARYSTLLGEDYDWKYTKAGSYRLEGFLLSMPLFAERPVLGYGPMTFQVVVNGLMPHNLYGQLLSELGILGAIAFAMILWGVGRNVVEARRIFHEAPHSRLAWNTVAGVGAVYVLLAIMSWGFNFLFWHVWLWFGAFQVVALQCLKEETVFQDDDYSAEAAIEP